MPSVMMAKTSHRADPTLQRKAWKFMEKLTEDDTTLGLHVEKVRSSVDDRVRTARVDQQYRAVLFRLDVAQQTIYYFDGIWNHDDAYRRAERATLRVNPINGLAEVLLQERTDQQVRYQAAPTASRFDGDELRPLPEVSSAGVPVVTHEAEDLVRVLGMDPEVAKRATQITCEDDLLALAESVGGWQGHAILELIHPCTLSDVRSRIGLDADVPVESDDVVDEAAAKQPELDQPKADETELDQKELDRVEGASVESPGDVLPDVAESQVTKSSDDDIVAAVKSSEASGQFVYFGSCEEVRAVIESGSFEDWLLFLHPEQKRYVSAQYKGPFRISGGAGTGKTVVVQHRCKELATQNPNARILVTTYTRNLAGYVQQGMEKMLPSSAFAKRLGEPGVAVKGIDAVAHAVVQSDRGRAEEAAVVVLGESVSTFTKRTRASTWDDVLFDHGDGLPEKLNSRQFFQDEYLLVVLANRITSLADYARVRRPGRGVALSRGDRKKVWEVIAAYRSRCRVEGTTDFSELCVIAAVALENGAPGRAFDHVLVDEGQDFSPAHWQLVRALVPEMANDLFIAEDSHQRIYGNKIVLSHYGIQIRGRSRRLWLNYRTTAQNLKLGVNILRGGDYSDLEGADEESSKYTSVRSGPEPVVLECSSQADQLLRVGELVQSWLDGVDGLSVPAEQVAILVRDRRGGDMVVSSLREAGLPVQLVASDGVVVGKISVMTMHRSKGTEFARVILFGVDKSSIPAPVRGHDYCDDSKNDVLLRERSLLYVAATRARDHLVITHTEDRSDLLPAGV